jgi:hypothetical protein
MALATTETRATSALESVHVWLLLEETVTRLGSLLDNDVYILNDINDD